MKEKFWFGKPSKVNIIDKVLEELNTKIQPADAHYLNAVPYHVYNLLHMQTQLHFQR